MGICAKMPKVKIKIQPSQNGDITIYSDGPGMEKDLQATVLQNFANYLAGKETVVDADEPDKGHIALPIFLDLKNINADGSFTINMEAQDVKVRLDKERLLQVVTQYANDYAEKMNNTAADIAQEENINVELKLEVESVPNKWSFLQTGTTNSDYLPPRFSEASSKNKNLLTFRQRTDDKPPADQSYMSSADNEMSTNQMDSMLAATNIQDPRKESFAPTTEQSTLGSMMPLPKSSMEQSQQSIAGPEIPSQEQKISDSKTTEDIFGRLQSKIGTEAKYKDKHLECASVTDGNNNNINFIKGSQGVIAEAVKNSYRFTRHNDDNGASELVIQDMLMLIKEKEPDKKWIIDCKTAEAAKPFIEILGKDNLSFRCSDELKDILQQKYPGIKFKDDLNLPKPPGFKKR